jgi:hypothetical protein
MQFYSATSFFLGPDLNHVSWLVKCNGTWTDETFRLCGSASQVQQNEFEKPAWVVFLQDGNLIDVKSICSEQLVLGAVSIWKRP